MTRPRSPTIKIAPTGEAPEKERPPPESVYRMHPGESLGAAKRIVQNVQLPAVALTAVALKKIDGQLARNEKQLPKHASANQGSAPITI